MHLDMLSIPVPVGHLQLHQNTDPLNVYAIHFTEKHREHIITNVDQSM